MNKVFRLFYEAIFPFPLIIGCVVLSFFSTCVDLDSNPISSDYDGDYELEIDFAQLPDTLTIFKLYTLPWEEKGSDTFYRITVKTDPSGKSLLSDELRPSPFPLYFTAPFTGLCIVNAVQPNDQAITYSDSITVVNPYRLTIDSASLLSNVNIGFRLLNVHTGEMAPSYLKYRRQIDESIVTIPADSSFSIAVSRPDTIVITTMLCDSMDHCVECSPLTVYVPEKVVPDVSVMEQALEVPVKSPFTFVASMTHSDSLRWRILHTNMDTVTTIESLTYVWDSICNDTIIVTAKNRFGSFGTSDTIFVQIREIEFEMEIITFPTSAAARKTTYWEVVAKREGEVVPDSEITYKWTVEPQSDIDSFEIDHGMLSLIPGEDADSFTVNVKAIIEDDTLIQRTAMVKVIVDKPVIQAFTRTDSAGIDDSIYFIVKAYDTNTGGSIEKIYCRKDPYSSPFELTSDSLLLTFADPGKHKITFWCVDNEGFTSDTLHSQVIITSYHPWFIYPRLDALVYIYDTLRIIAPAMAGNPGGSIESWFWDTDADDQWDRKTSKNYVDTVFTSAGNFKFIVGCIDNFSDSADTKMQFLVVVSDGAPQVTAVAPLNEPQFIGDTLKVRIIAFDPNGTITTLQIIGGPNLQTVSFPSSPDSIDTIIPLIMQNTGVIRIAARVIDNHGLISDTAFTPDSFTIESGVPVASTASFPDSVWINDETTITLSGNDPNGSIETWAIQWNDDAAFMTRDNDGTFTHTFNDTGVYTVRGYVVDDDGNVSDTIAHEVTVRLGAPFFNEIAIDTDRNALFINDSITFTIRATDPNGHLDSLFVYIGDDLEEQPDVRRQADNDHAEFIYVFDESDIGVRAIRLRVQDIAGFTTDSVLTLTIRRGTPVVTSAECENDTVWVNDDFRFDISANDTNGVLRMLYVNWDGGDSPQDSIEVSNDRTSIDTFFTHAYDTTGGSTTARFFAKDDDGLISSSRDISIEVKKGAPVVWGDKGDTLWVVVDNDFGNYYFKPQYFDTNGTITSFFFGLTNNRATAVESDADSALIIVDENNINKGSTRYIWVKDDDGLIRGSKFVVFADSAPPQPILIGPETDTLYSTTDAPVVFRWSGFDIHDGPATEYAVLINPPGTDTPEEIIQNYRSASDFDKEGDTIMYTFTPKTSGIHSWRIVAHDIQGSATSSDTWQFGHPGQ